MVDERAVQYILSRPRYSPSEKTVKRLKLRITKLRAALEAAPPAQYDRAEIYDWTSDYVAWFDGPRAEALNAPSKEEKP